MPPDVFSDLRCSIMNHRVGTDFTQAPVYASGGGDECLRRWEPYLCRLAGVMQICGVEVTGSGRSRA